MNIQSIMFMCNDFKKAEFTLSNFQKHNPEIPIRVINSGGEDPKDHLKNIIKLEIINTTNLWHKKTHCGTGSFSYKYFDYLFDYGMNKEYTHTLYLETDVLTNRKITIEPKYDISGPLGRCGPKEDILYEYLGIEDDKLHAGCGGSIFSIKYFETIKQNFYHMYKDLFEKFPENYFMDLIASLVAKKAGLSVGHWEETTNMYGNFVDGVKKNVDMNATLVHWYKI